MEWTKEANQIFESHVRENQATWKKAGGNVAEVSDDLRGHVEESAHAARGWGQGMGSSLDLRLFNG